MKKRLFSLLLILSLFLSLWVSAGAADPDFKDKNEITYQEAVTVLSREGIISGFEDGTFRPKETLTREQACKILTMILRGQPEGIPAFQDVSANSWSATYIAYCANNELVAGVGGGKFNPKGQLTGSAWSKLLLTALGYDAEQAGMLGKDWETGVANLASAELLYAGIADFDPAKPVTRDEACQIAYNAMYDGEVPEPASDILFNLSYSFSNSRAAFSYPNPYHIPMEIFRLVYGDEIKAEKMYETFGNWNGNCYGMVSTAGILYQYGNGISPGDFNSWAAAPGALSVQDRDEAISLTLTQFIEAVHISQLTEEASEVRNRNMNQLSYLCDAVADSRLSGRAPVLICVWGEGGGHAIMGYEVQHISDSEARILVYDPNYPMTERYITLYKSGGDFVGWSYPLFSDTVWGSAYGGRISYIPYDDYYQGWQNRKGSVVTSDMLFLTVSDDATIYDDFGKAVASIQDGSVTVYQEGAYPLNNVGVVLDELGLPSTKTTVWLPGHYYFVRHTGEGEFTVELTEKEQTVSITTTAASVTMNVADDSATRTAGLSAGQGGATYVIEIRSSMEEDGGPASIKLSGVASDDALTAGSVQGSLVTDGVDQTKSTLYVDGKEVYDNFDDSSESILTIGTIEELIAFAQDVNDGKDYKGQTVTLTDDLYLNYNVLDDSDDFFELNAGSFVTWVPIGTSDHPFRGTFDGKGYTIHGLYVDDMNAENQGLFGVIEGGTVCNVTVADSWFNVYTVAGPIVGYARNRSVIDACSSKNCAVRTVGRSGGIVGWTDHSDVYNCAATVLCVSDRCSGGIVGDVYAEGDIYNCSVSGRILGNNLCCGITGGSTAADLQNCLCLAEVQGYLIVGGPGYRSSAWCYALVKGDGSLGVSSDTVCAFNESGELSAPVVVDGVSYTNVLDALNAWVDANNANVGRIAYPNWHLSDGYPCLD